LIVVTRVIDVPNLLGQDEGVGRFSVYEHEPGELRTITPMVFTFDCCARPQRAMRHRAA
jgi:hypothetical protein